MVGGDVDRIPESLLRDIGERLRDVLRGDLTGLERLLVLVATGLRRRDETRDRVCRRDRRAASVAGILAIAAQEPATTRRPGSA